MTEMPEFQIAALAASATVLVNELDVEEDRAIEVAILIYIAVVEALEEFGPELTLTAAEVLWDHK